MIETRELKARFQEIFREKETLEKSNETIEDDLIETDLKGKATRLLAISRKTLY
jgi:hypothetical protein